MLAFLASALLNATGRGPVAVALVILGGIAILIALTRAVTWCESQATGERDRTASRP